MLSLKASIISRRSRGAMAPSCTARSTIALNPSTNRRVHTQHRSELRQPYRLLARASARTGHRPATPPSPHWYRRTNYANRPAFPDRHRQKTHRDSNRVSHQAHARHVFETPSPSTKRSILPSLSQVISLITARRVGFRAIWSGAIGCNWSMAQTSGRLWNREKLP